MFTVFLLVPPTLLLVRRVFDYLPWSTFLVNFETKRGKGDPLFIESARFCLHSVQVINSVCYFIPFTFFSRRHIEDEREKCYLLLYHPPLLRPEPQSRKVENTRLERLMVFSFE